MLNIMFGQSKYYVDSLSENTKRGLREKVRRGEYPGCAPIGYLNDYRTKRVIVDRERAPLVKQAFEQYATGRGDARRIAALFRRTQGEDKKRQNWLAALSFPTCFQIPFTTAISAMPAKCMKASTRRSFQRNCSTTPKPF